MCDPIVFAAHYGWVLSALGQTFDVLEDGRIHTKRAGLHFVISNTAPYEPELLVVECPAPLSDPAITAEALWRTRLPPTVSIQVADGHINARAELALAGPGQLPDPSLLTAVLPPVLDRLDQTVYDYVMALTLAGIKHATQAAAKARPELWATD